MLVIGTSAQIEPAASLPIVAKGMRSMFRGMGGFFTKINSHVVEINREPTPLTGEVSDFLIQGGAGDILSTIVRNVREKGVERGHLGSHTGVHYPCSPIRQCHGPPHLQPYLLKDGPRHGLHLP